MYVPERTRDRISYEFNNPALCCDNGVICSYCCSCGAYIGSEDDTDWYKLIKQEYCDDCRKKVQTEQSKLRMRKMRKNRRKEKKELKQQSNLLKQENQLLKEMVVALRDDLDKLKKE